MARSLALTDPRAVADLRTFLSRARSLDAQGAVRFQSRGRALGIYVCVLEPHGLLDRTPTVLGLRTAALAQEQPLDVTVSLGAVLDRMPRQEEDTAEVGLPPMDATVSWAGIAPPLGGWAPVGAVAADTVREAARAGIAEVARTVPVDAGSAVVDTVRSQVWGRSSAWAQPVAGALTGGPVPDGAAFAAWSLGFLRPGEQVAVAENGRWVRLSAPGGHVLVKR
ncbi:hypothetical protein GCM10011374_26440 [Kocuria dechangensis]|uniref:Uncharacterized protein n=1 Tax=Kocuria dechangensis TaxID=1176249 RepID=A0A917GYG2_9MICC|nr:hypothetical protein [Kocuria dechangensis]GGG62031.1 hypothetical protein GCM10011374_26440 [Kocuria dechangensis]